MIRFSASLVVVALGLLVAGGVASKLLLVYAAIAVSVIALAFLVIGAILNRGELRASSPAEAPGGRLDQVSAARLGQAPSDDRDEAAAGRPDSVAAGVPGDDLTSLTKRPDRLDGPVAGVPGDDPASLTRRPDRLDGPVAGVPGDDPASLTRRPDRLDGPVAGVPGDDPIARPDAAPPGRRGETPAAQPGSASAGWADQAQRADAATADQYVRPDTPPPGPSDTTRAVDTSGPEDTGNAKDTGAGAGGAEDLAGTQPADQPVTVVPGVPRYHRSDCILIRFMGDSDLQKMPVEAARKNGCTPCRACHADGEKTG